MTGDLQATFRKQGYALAVQATGPHYLLGHNIGGHFGPAGGQRRETIYFRLHAAGHRERCREVVTDPLVELR